MKRIICSALNSLLLLAVTTVSSQVVSCSVASADGMPDENPRRRVERLVPRVEPPPPPPPMREDTSVRMERTEMVEEPCEWKVRLSPGMTVWFFDEEDTLPGPSAYIETWRTDIPVALRLGVEGRHMYLGQDAAKYAEEFPGKTTKVTFLRIPIAVEYMHDVAENTTWYAGLGPDIIHTANDIGDTNVGFHLSTRVHYAFNEHWGTGVEAGYMWGDVDGEGKDVKLDNAFITPTVSYTF